MKTIILILFFFILTAGCKTAPKTYSNKPIKITHNTRRDSFITTPCAVLIYPSDRKIDSLKIKDGEDFSTIADDNQYYMGQSIGFLDSVKVKQITKSSQGKAVFKSKTGEIFRFTLDSLYWSILLFNGRTTPLKADILNIDDDYKNYMGK